MNTLRTANAGLPCWVLGAIAITAFFSANSFADDNATPPVEATVVAGKIVHPNGSPATGVTVSVTTIYSGTTHASQTDDAGQFRLVFQQDPDASALGACLHAESDDGTLVVREPLGKYENGRYVLPDRPLELQLQPATFVRVVVVDGEGDPIERCRVIASTNRFPARISGTTKADGSLTFRYPVSEKIVQLLAWKSGRGLAYRYYVRDPRDKGLGDAAPTTLDRQEERLTLTGAQTIRVRVVDEAGKPLPNCHVRPWLLHPPDRVSSLNLTHFASELRRITDADGMATFDWIPTWQECPVTVWGYLTGYSAQRVNVLASPENDSSKTHAVLVLRRLIKLTGKVVDRNGKPVAGVLVKILGDRDERFFRDLTTDSAGNYECDVPPYLAYLVTARQSEHDRVIGVSDTLTGFSVSSGPAVQVPDLVLRKPTIVSGVLKSESRSSVADQAITIYHYGQRFSELPPDQQAGAPGSRSGSQPILIYHTKTDPSGAFTFALGNGRYDVRPPGKPSAHPFEILNRPPPPIHLTWKTNQVDQRTFSGTVKMPDGTPVVGVVVEGIADVYRDGWKTVTDDQGSFSVSEKQIAKTLRVITQDLSHGVSTSVDASQRHSALTVQPTGDATIRLLSEAGEPIVSRELQLSEVVRQIEPGRRMKNRPGVAARTDETGTVRYHNLLPDALYSLTADNPSGGSGRSRLTQFRILPGQSYQTTIYQRSGLR